MKTGEFAYTQCICDREELNYICSPLHRSTGYQMESFLPSGLVNKNMADPQHKPDFINNWIILARAMLCLVFTAFQGSFSLTFMHLFVSCRQGSGAQVLGQLVDDFLSENLKNFNERIYELDLEKLQTFWHMGMIRGFLKAKGRSLCAKLLKIDCIIYINCEKDARSVVQLSRCVVGLMDAKNRYKLSVTEKKAKANQKAGDKSSLSSIIPGYNYINKSVKTLLWELERLFSIRKIDRKNNGNNGKIDAIKSKLSKQKSSNYLSNRWSKMNLRKFLSEKMAISDKKIKPTNFGRYRDSRDINHLKNISQLNRRWPLPPFYRKERMSSRFHKNEHWKYMSKFMCRRISQKHHKRTNRLSISNPLNQLRCNLRMKRSVWQTFRKGFIYVHSIYY
ncbi:unnamed protein product [Dracunculus medinensis]|uniref:Translocon at the inner envelope membrane of chloroplasts 214 n=1 Tax=Dracunculus medinensis TaxID=318479 RepID=A0A0N4UCD9_DRAME|nr:unnamed protein product [Dracunculus medinensis]